MTINNQDKKPTNNIFKKFIDFIINKFFFLKNKNKKKNIKETSTDDVYPLF